MKAKKFVAPDMRQALKLVRDNMGADAVILSNRKVAGGVEVSVALDYEQAMEDHRRNEREKSHIPQYTNGNEQFSPAQGDSTRILKETLAAVKDKERREEMRERLSAQRQQLDTGAHSEFLDSYRRDGVSISAAGQQKNYAEKLMPPAGNRPSTDRSMVAAPPAETMQPSEPMLPPEPEQLAKPKKPSFFDEYETRVENEREVMARAEEDYYAEVQARAAQQQQDVSMAFDEPVHQAAAYQEAASKEAQPAGSQEDMNQMRSELQQLRSMINSQLGNVAWGDFSYRHPVSAAIFKRLVKMGLSPALSRSLSQQVDNQSSKKEAWHDVLVNLSSRIPVFDTPVPKKEGRIAFVGPAGVGKTTTIAKLAAEYVLAHGPENLALVTTDSYRIAGHEQLRVLSKILKVPLRVIAGNQSLESALRGLSRKKMVLIDTAGLSHKDCAWAEQVSLLTSATTPIQKWLVLSATSQQRILDKAVMDYKSLGLDGCVLTKLDESASLGEALTVAIEHQLSVAYTTNGQNIPDDIEQAKPRSLVNQAIALTKQATLDDELAADCFNESIRSGNGEFTAA